MTTEIVHGNAQDWADRLNDEWRSTVRGIIAVGASLNAAKAELPHGEFGRIFSDHQEAVERPFVMGYSSGVKLMSVASHPTLSNVEYIPHLPPAWGTLGILTRIKDVKGAIESGDIYPTMGQKDAQALANQSEKHEHEAVSNTVTSIPRRYL